MKNKQKVNTFGYIFVIKLHRTENLRVLHLHALFCIKRDIFKYVKEIEKFIWILKKSRFVCKEKKIYELDNIFYQFVNYCFTLFLSKIFVFDYFNIVNFPSDFGDTQVRYSSLLTRYFIIQNHFINKLRIHVLQLYLRIIQNNYFFIFNVSVDSNK